MLEPAITEAPITLELVGSKGRVVRLVHTDPKGRYEVYLSNLGKGNYQLLASFGGDDLHASSESEPVKLRIT